MEERPLAADPSAELGQQMGQQLSPSHTYAKLGEPDAEVACQYARLIVDSVDHVLAQNVVIGIGLVGQEVRRNEVCLRELRPARHHRRIAVST